MSTGDLSRLPKPSRSYQFFTIGFGLLISALLVLFIVRQWVHTSNLVNPKVDFPAYLNSHAQVASDAKTTTAVALPAGSVYQIDVNNRAIWLCVFDQKSADEKRELETLHDKPSVEIDGKNRPVDVQGSMALVGYDGRPDEKEIVRLFDEFAKAPR